MPPRILIADDSLNVRTALHQLLSHIHPAELLEAANGHEAVSKALEFSPEVVILDFVMPVTDGLTAARKILQQLPQTAIFICTMHWSQYLEEQATAIGVRQVISKAQSSLLIAAVEQFLNDQPPSADPASAPASPDTIAEDLPDPARP
ncbi:MAG TPA: response regulator transcription factor [Candidatus Sulfotelmatobacter sp.]|nr:response regulator transcription factor [Candidatus Sulfotelmatobacter sp.]